MADFRPFQALRYDPSFAGAAADLVAPPYDVVSPADAAALYARSPYNIARVDYGADRPGDNEHDNRYTRARTGLRDWQNAGALRRDSSPHLYVYDQEFLLDGRRLRRRAVFGRLRLEEFEKGIILPHEVTGAGAKADRLNLLQATNTHLSPVMALYNSGPAIPEDAIGAPVLDAVLPEDRHTLRPVSDEAAAAFTAALAGQRLYIADGHHRYETGLNYRNQRRAEASTWVDDRPENFILAALIDVADPGLIVLPTHRLLKLPQRNPDAITQLEALFQVEKLASADELDRRLTEAGRQGPAFGAIGLEPGGFHLLTPRNLEAAIARTPADHGPRWRGLDVTVLQYAVLPATGFDDAPEHIDYTEDYRHAAKAVESGEWDAALLLNPTAIDDVTGVADSGERMPRKSTFFFPKLATGVVLLPLD